MKKTLIVSLLVALVALTVVVACAPAPTATPVPPTKAPEPTKAAAQPTAAPAQPTAAPKPTDAPKPTEAPKPTTAPTAAPVVLTKFPFRLNWTLYGEHAGFFVAREKGFYAEEGLDVDIQEGGGSGVVAGLVANNQSPVAYIDSATMIQRVVGGMPIKAVAVMLQQSPMAFIYRADAAKPTKVSEIKGSRIAITQGDASLAIFTAFLGKEGLKLDDVQFVMTANPQAKEQAVLNKQADALLGYFMDQGPRMQLQTGVKMGWTRLYDINGTSTLSSAIVVNNEWIKDAKNQDVLKRFLRATQRGWQYTSENRAEAAKIFIKYAPAFTEEIAKLEIDGTMTILQSPRTKGKALGYSDEADWKDSQDLLAKFAEMKDPKSDVKVFFDNSFLSEAPYMLKK
ncbi:MAG: ABC transporter substrate-binding protein [Chloroflexi bacterium]|nr:ABC transporter substrate-binding protein [Chloroflexota bacterium]